MVYVPTTPVMAWSRRPIRTVELHIPPMAFFRIRRGRQRGRLSETAGNTGDNHAPLDPSCCYLCPSAAFLSKMYIYICFMVLLLLSLLLLLLWLFCLVYCVQTVAKLRQCAQQFRHRSAGQGWWNGRLGPSQRVDCARGRAPFPWRHSVASASRSRSLQLGCPQFVSQHFLL